MSLLYLCIEVAFLPCGGLEGHEVAVEQANLHHRLSGQLLVHVIIATRCASTAVCDAPAYAPR